MTRSLFTVPTLSPTPGQARWVAAAGPDTFAPLGLVDAGALAEGYASEGEVFRATRELFDGGLVPDPPPRRLAADPPRFDGASKAELIEALRARPSLAPERERRLGRAAEVLRFHLRLAVLRHPKGLRRALEAVQLASRSRPERPILFHRSDGRLRWKEEEVQRAFEGLAEELDRSAPPLDALAARSTPGRAAGWELALARAAATFATVRFDPKAVWAWSGDVGASDEAGVERIQRSRAAYDACVGELVAGSLHMVGDVLAEVVEATLEAGPLARAILESVHRGKHTFDVRRGYRFSTYAVWWARAGAQRAGATLKRRADG